jgi:hypothetical protein
VFVDREDAERDDVVTLEVEPAVGLQVHGAAAQAEVTQVAQQLLGKPAAIGGERFAFAVQRFT